MKSLELTRSYSVNTTKAGHLNVASQGGGAVASVIPDPADVALLSVVDVVVSNHPTP